MNYSDRQKAEALAALDSNKGNVSRTAKEINIPRKTLEMWAKARGVNNDVAEIRQHKKSDLADIFENIARTYLGEAAKDDKIAKTSGKDAIIAAATATDKMRLLRELPTDITKHTSPVVFAIQIVKNIKVERPEISNKEIVELIDSGAIDVPEVDADTWIEVRGLLADGK